jgi:hypothetical protein
MEPEFKQLEEQRKALGVEVQEFERQLTKAQGAAQEFVSVGKDLSAKERRPRSAGERASRDSLRIRRAASRGTGARTESVGTVE